MYVSAAAKAELSRLENRRNDSDGLVRISPLVLKDTLFGWARRRAGLFADFEIQETHFGARAFVTKHVRPSTRNPEGRVVQGELSIIELSPKVIILASILSSDQYANLKKPLEVRSYPVGQLPFVSSTQVFEKISDLAREMNAVANITYAHGFHSPGNESWEDHRMIDPMTLEKELRILRRTAHKLTAHFQFESDRAPLRWTVDRYARVTVHDGPAEDALSKLVVPLVTLFEETRSMTSFVQSRDWGDLQEVEITLNILPLDDERPKHLTLSIASGLRELSGLIVTTMSESSPGHISVIDVLSGGVADIVVDGAGSLRIIPFFGCNSDVVSRITNALSRFYSELKSAERHGLSFERSWNGD